MENFLTENRLKKYLLFTNNNIKRSLELYDLNVKVSESFYTLLCYFEVFLRNFCNEKLIKEIGENWFDNKFLKGNNKNKSQKTIEEIEKTKSKIIKYKQEKKIINYIPTNADIVSNLEFGFWSNLFCANYENTIWAPYLKQIFVGFTRKELFKIINNIRKLRNRIFHYEPIIFDKTLLEKYNDIVSIICFISNQEICNCIESRSNFKELYKILKNSGAPLN